MHCKSAVIDDDFLPQKLARLQQSASALMRPNFHDRREAGRALAAALQTHPIGEAPVVVALPRGGVPVGFEVAAGLNAPLDVCVVRRVEVPHGGGFLNLAVASGRVILSESKRAASTIPEKMLLRIAQREGCEISRRERAYRGEHSEVGVKGRPVVLVDDGLGSPEPFVAAVAAIRARAAARVIVAVPVAASSSYRQLFAIVDDVVCLELPQPFHGVGASYADFSEISDLDVRVLHEAARDRARREFCH
jgi:predicted phosphoribosyltransferase